LRTSRTRARDRSKTLVRNSYIRFVCLRRKRTDNGKVPGGRGAQLGQEDLHELQCTKCHKGDALQEVWLQRPQDKDPRNEEGLDRLRPHDSSITSGSRAGVLENRDKKKRVEETPPQLGITLWSHLSFSYRRVCLPKWLPLIHSTDHNLSDGQMPDCCNTAT